MRLRLDGTGLFWGVGATFLVVGLLAFLLIVQQPSHTLAGAVEAKGVKRIGSDAGLSSSRPQSLW